MLRKFFLICIFMTMLLSCGYEAIYLEKKNFNFNISSLEVNGDRDINNKIILGLKKYSKTNSNKSYKLKINTTYLKTSMAKDKTGNITDFKLEAQLILEYFTQNKPIKILFSENFVMKKDTNSFEQRKYEKTIKNNLSDLLLKKVIFHLAKI